MNKIYLIFGVMCVAVLAVSGQTTIQLNGATVMDQVQAKLKAAPSTSPKALAEVANRLAAQQGYGFGFDPDNFKERNVTVRGRQLARFDLIGTDGRKLEFISERRGDHPCGTWTEFPVTRVKGNVFDLVSDGNTYPTRIPRQFARDNMELVDSSLRRVIRRWDVPMDSTPEAISADGTKIYLFTELDQLYLEVDSLGKYRYVPSDAPNLIKKHTDLTNFPEDKKNAYLSFRRFTQGATLYTIRYSGPCT